MPVPGFTATVKFSSDREQIFLGNFSRRSFCLLSKFFEILKHGKSSKKKSYN